MKTGNNLVNVQWCGNSHTGHCLLNLVSCYACQNVQVCTCMVAQYFLTLDLRNDIKLLKYCDTILVFGGINTLKLEVHQLS